MTLDTSNKISQSVDEAFCLQAILAATTKELYVIDATTLHFVTASDSALRNLNHSRVELQSMVVEDIFHEVRHDALKQYLTRFKDEDYVVEPIPMSQFDGSSSSLKMVFIKNDQRETIVATRNDQTELDESESRFQAIVANIPSMVFQCRLNPNNEIQFNYVSENCRALLGINAEDLLEHPGKLFALILPEDRESFLQSMRTSADQLVVWNWEGGLWIEKWQDVKLVNLRATARINTHGVVEWGGVITNITQSRNEKREIEESHRRLAELSSHLSLIKEQERLHIAREVHDDLGGNLTAIKIGLASLAGKLDKNQQVLLDKAQQLEQLVDNTFEAAHRITRNLRPDVIELGIVAALEWQAKEFEKQIGIPCEFITNDENIDLTTDQAIVLFRVCQEATSNIAKYAKASHVLVELINDANKISMRILDDGIGISSADKLKNNAFGLRGMAERVTAIGGSFSIGTGEHGGTEVLVQLTL
jgi:signal transduction histidine kinase